MAKRITIMLDDDLDKKLRLIQAKAIQSTSSSVSFSSIMNEILRKQLR
jgi:predicted transcriptional regulator